MRFPTRIALRYIFTFRSFHFITFITLISILGMIVGVAALICVISIFNGFREFAENQLIGFDPHIRISAKGAPWLPASDSLLNQIRKMPEVDAASPIIQGRAVAINGNNMQVIYLNGVNRDEFSSVSGIASRIVVGKFNIADYHYTPGIVVGAGLADKLRVLPGDSVSILSPAMIESSIRSLSKENGIKTVVTGIFQTHNNEYDDIYGYVSDFIGASVFNAPEKQYSSIDIRLKSIEDLEKATIKIKAFAPKDTEVLTWNDLHKELFNVMQFERLAAFVVLSLIIIIAVFNVLASLSMTVVEKRPDIAILKAMGATNSAIRKIFLTEGIIIGLISSVTGTLLGVGLSLGQIQYGWFKLDTSKYLINAIPVSIHEWDVVIIFIFALLLSYLTTIYPAKRAAESNILSSLRQE